jgi:hypothetical protein
MKLFELTPPRLPIYTSPDRWLNAVKAVGAKAEVDPEKNHRTPSVVYARKDGKDVGVWVEDHEISAGSVFKTPQEFEAWTRRGDTLGHALQRALKDSTMSEEVVDMEDHFKQKRGENMKRRFMDAVQDAPKQMKKQEELEKWFNGELNKIDQIPNREMFADRKELREPLKHFHAKNNIIKSLWSATNLNDIGEDDKKAEDIAKQFILKNIDKILRILKKQEDALKELVQKADKEKWPASWRRYTSYPYFSHELNHLLQDFELIKKTKKFK